MFLDRCSSLETFWNTYTDTGWTNITAQHTNRVLQKSGKSSYFDTFGDLGVHGWLQTVNYYYNSMSSFYWINSLQCCFDFQTLLGMALMSVNPSGGVFRVLRSPWPQIHRFGAKKCNGKSKSLPSFSQNSVIPEISVRFRLPNTMWRLAGNTQKSYRLLRFAKSVADFLKLLS